MIPTVPISEIPRLLQAYVDEGIGLSCFIVVQIMRHYLSWADFAVFKRFTLYFQRIPLTEYFVNF